MKLLKVILAFSLFASLSFANGKSIAIQLKLNASSKAIKQWERVFKKEHKMKRLGIDKLSANDKASLEKYLLDHAADSDHPEAAGL